MHGSWRRDCSASSRHAAWRGRSCHCHPLQSPAGGGHAPQPAAATGPVQYWSGCRVLLDCVLNMGQTWAGHAGARPGECPLVFLPPCADPPCCPPPPVPPRPAPPRPTWMDRSSLAMCGSPLSTRQRWRASPALTLGWRGPWTSHTPTLQPPATWCTARTLYRKLLYKVLQAHVMVAQQSAAAAKQRCQPVAQLRQQDLAQRTRFCRLVAAPLHQQLLLRRRRRRRWWLRRWCWCC